MKVLIVRFSSIGDIVLTTPIIRCMAKQGIEVHYLTKSVYRQLLEANPYLKKIHCLKDRLREIMPTLRNEKFDHIIDLHKNLRSARVRLGMGVKSFTFDKINFQKWLAVNLKINILPKIHIVDRYFQAVKPLGIFNDGRGLDYFLPPKHSDKVPFLAGDGPYICIAIGGAHNTKKLPWERLRDLCRLSMPIVLIGSKGDEETGNRIATGLDSVSNLCGKLDFHQSAATIKHSRVVVSHDTGMMHIAAALQKPIISIWGNTIPGFGMYPYFPDSSEIASYIAEVDGLRCRPCSKIGYSSCPKGHFRCMQDQDIPSIRQKMAELSKIQTN